MHRLSQQRTSEEQDRQLCLELLPRVSRSFALSIAALPDELQDAVRTAYLLCRVVDSIEDTCGRQGEQREQLFEQFQRLVAEDRGDPGPLQHGLNAAAECLSTAEAELGRQCGAVLREFRRLPDGQRRAIRPAVLTMTRGMTIYARRRDQAGRLRLHDLHDLENYCYYVAGTVGELLTALFLEAVPGLPAETVDALARRAVPFGTGLQLVNILKDISDDFRRGVCYLPEALAGEHGVDLDRLLAEEGRAAGLSLVRALCARAREHLERAAQYTLLWPAGRGDAVRLFCAVPLSLARATLTVVERGEDTLRPGVTPRVAEGEALRLLAASRGAVSDDQALAALLRD